MSSPAASPYAKFPVRETIDIAQLSDIRSVVDRIVDAYIVQNPSGVFSYRLLLPRGEKLTTKAKRIGLAVQGEFLLALKKKRLKPNVKEVRYVHDDTHYGWLLANPQVYDQLGI